MTYDNQLILLATKHKKETVIAPVFSKYLGCNIVVPSDFDTDQFGTFSGEIPRLKPPLATAIDKAQDAINRFNHPYAIASEGSFGPHPAFYFAPADMEIMVFVDQTRQLTITETEVSTETNYGSLTVSALNQHQDFLTEVHFPSHRLMVRSLDDAKIIAKGIGDEVSLNLALQQALSSSKEARIETDMRAMHNPTRMKIIERLARKLAERVATCCVGCGTPGFGHTETKGSLPCSVCGSATELHEYIVLSCLKCDYTVTKQRVDGLEQADPQFCQYCNP